MCTNLPILRGQQIIPLSGWGGGGGRSVGLLPLLTPPLKSATVRDLKTPVFARKKPHRILLRLSTHCFVDKSNTFCEEHLTLVMKLIL